jgi:hypothetical protein
MSEGNSLLSVVKGHRTVFIAIGVILLILELTIFAIAAVRSGEHYRLQFIDQNGNMVYETDGRNLSDFNKYQFEKTHGSLRDYSRKLVKQDVPFPFRAWFVAALGLPLGLILVFVFVLKAYTALFYGEGEREKDSERPASRYETRLEKLIGGVQKFNVFVIGGAVFLIVIAYWVLPNLVIYLGEVGVETLVRFRWVLVLVGVAAFALLVFVIYLKFLLAKKSIDSQVEVDKYRMQLEYKQDRASQLQLEHKKNGKGPTAMVGWAGDGDVVEGDSPEEH